MKPLLSFSLATLATLCVAGCTTTYTVAQASPGPGCRRIAQPGDTKIQIYCSKERSDSVASAAGHVEGTSCRRLVRPETAKFENFCGNASEWAQYDTLAVNAGITCRWQNARDKNIPSEVCLTAALWRGYDLSRSGGTVNATDAGFPPNASLGTNSPGPQMGGASYGYFPAGTSIGATQPAGPPR